MSGAPLSKDWRPTEAQVGDAAWELGRAAVKPFHEPALRDAILSARRQDEMLRIVQALLVEENAGAENDRACIRITQFVSLQEIHDAIRVVRDECLESGQRDDPEARPMISRKANGPK
jgi:hypothetical protein